MKIVFVTLLSTLILVLSVYVFAEEGHRRNDHLHHREKNPERYTDNKNMNEKFEDNTCGGE